MSAPRAVSSAVAPSTCPAGGLPADPDAGLLALLEEWLALRAELNGPGAVMDAAWHLRLRHLHDLEAAVASARPSTCRGWAAQVVVADDFGDLSGTDVQLALVAQALALLGLPPAGGGVAAHGHREDRA